MTMKNFQWCLEEMDARYSSGVPRYVHSFINGMIYALQTTDQLSRVEAQTLYETNQKRPDQVPEEKL